MFGVPLCILILIGRCGQRLAKAADQRYIAPMVHSTKESAKQMVSKAEELEEDEDVELEGERTVGEFGEVRLLAAPRD